MIRAGNCMRNPGAGRSAGSADVSAHELATVDLDDLTHQVVGRGRREERDDPRGLLGGALPPHRYGVLEVLAHVGGREAVVEGGRYDARGDPVYQDVLGDELFGHGAGQGADTTLGRGVGDRAGSATVAGGDGGHVDDPAPPRRFISGSIASETR